MKRLNLILVCLSLLLAACTSGPPPAPEGPTVGELPILDGATELESVSVALRTVTQPHLETVEDETLGYFHVEQGLIDTIDWYDDTLRSYGWQLIDVLEFGDGGFLRRYYRGDERAIVAFHPADAGTDFLLLQGDVR